MHPRQLAPLPGEFAATVTSLHEVATALLAPVCKAAGEPALTALPGGFGTPELQLDGCRQQVRVEGAELVRTVDGAERRAPITSLAHAGTSIADLLGPAARQLSGRPLAVDECSSRVLGALYGLAAEALGVLLEGASLEDGATPPRLWPEHFDIAIELGSEHDGLRANYGLSPGDEQHPEPYLYVGPWTAAVSGAAWNACGFAGAELGHAELLGASDPLRAATDFFETRRRLLASEMGRGR